MPMYAKFLKKILSKKRKIDEHETIALYEKFSVMVLNKFPTKLNDIGSSSISYLTRNVSINRACLLYTSPSPRDGLLSRMPSSA